MKNLIVIALLLLLCLSVNGQGTVQRGKMSNGKYRYIFVYSLNNRSADNIYRQVKQYAASAGHLSADRRFRYGTAQLDKEKKIISLPLTITYDGRGLGCFGTLVLKGNAIFAAKDGKCKLEFSGFSYENFNPVTNKLEKIKTYKETFCPGADYIETLADCQYCQDDLGNVLEYVFLHYKETVKDFHAFLKAYMKSSAQDF